MIEAGLVTLLLADTTLSGLISNRLYPVLLPEPTTYPCLSYQVITASSYFSFDRREIATTRIQFDAWGNSYADCKNVLLALDHVLNAYSGTLADGTKILIAVSLQELDGFESDSRVFRSIAEYEIQHA